MEMAYVFIGVGIGWFGALILTGYFNILFYIQGQKVLKNIEVKLKIRRNLKANWNSVTYSLKP